MKLLNKTISAAALALTLIATGPAAAYTISDINTSVSSANVFLDVEDGIATLSGSVEGVFEKSSLENAARNLDGVHTVENHLFITK